MAAQAGRGLADSARAQSCGAAAPADWRPGLDVVGYWWPAGTAWEPPAELTAFLDAGPPPVFVGFGSMAGGHGEWLAPLVVTALREAGVRGILQAGSDCAS